MFNLDADAYLALKNYIDSLKTIFGDRLQKLKKLFRTLSNVLQIFLKKPKGKRQVVNLKDINDIIAMMGTAKDFAGRRNQQKKKKSSDGEQNKAESSNYTGESKRFYRDIDNNILGGVCSGLGIYLNIDPLWIRLAFVALFFLKGVGLIAYIIMWL